MSTSSLDHLKHLLIDLIEEGVPLVQFSKARVAFNLLKMINDLKVGGASDVEIFVAIVDKLITTSADTSHLGS